MSEVIDFGAKGSGETKLFDVLEGETFDEARARMEAEGHVVIDAAEYDDSEGRHRVVEVKVPAVEQTQVEEILRQIGHGPVESQRAA